MKTIFLSLLVIQLIGCSAEVGSEKWCSSLQEKPKGDWSTNEAADYAKHCAFK
jgi:hypothetical protein